MICLSHPHRLFSKVGLLACLLASSFWMASRAEAAYTTNFFPLVRELEQRSLLLSNSTNKVEKKQKRVLDAAVNTIRNSTNSLATDLVAVAKVSRALRRAFPSDFNSAMAVSLESLLDQTFTNLQADVVVSVKTLQELEAGLPDGKLKIQAHMALTNALAKLSLVNDNTDFVAWAQLLGGSLTITVKTIAMVQHALTSGPNTLVASATIGGVTSTWLTGAAGGVWFQSEGRLALGGNFTNGQINMSIGSGFHGLAGTYGLSGDSMLKYPDYFYITTGLVTIVSFDQNTRSASGTFSFVADGPSNITVSNGVFNLHRMTFTP